MDFTKIFQLKKAQKQRIHKLLWMLWFDEKSISKVYTKAFNVRIRISCGSRFFLMDNVSSASGLKKVWHFQGWKWYFMHWITKFLTLTKSPWKSKLSFNQVQWVLIEYYYWTGIAKYNIINLCQNIAKLYSPQCRRLM